MNPQSIETPKKVAKKPYHAPKLLVYGDLREMTLKIGGQGQRDNQTNPRLPHRTGR
jgi:hypothetical protein